MKKIKAFLLLNTKVKLLLIESYFYLAWARILKFIPFSKVAPSLGIEMMETNFSKEALNRKDLYHISYAINMMSRYTFWESACLVKAIAALKMLEKRQIESTLYLGTAKDEEDQLIAHAWLRCGPYFITGAEGREQFIVVNKFAKKVG